MNRQGSVLFEAPLEHELPTNPSKEPFAVGPGNSVPFAAPPPIGSYWPIKATGKKGRHVSYSYKASNGSIKGIDGLMFMADRTGKRGKVKGVPRWHVGVDLLANKGDVVVSCEDGTIVGFHPFLKAESDNQQTYALLIKHSTAVVNYGEVAPDSLDRNNLRIGMKVQAGQPIAIVGSTNMLHFETYIKGTTSSQRWWKDKKWPPRELLNPTNYLLFLQQYGLPQQASVSTPAPRRQVSTSIQASGKSLQGPFGVLSFAAKGYPRFTYTFTREDAEWTARFLLGEAGGKNNPDNQAILWAMFNRYALF